MLIVISTRLFKLERELEILASQLPLPIGLPVVVVHGAGIEPALSLL